jgi:hypothetical protein
LLSCGTRPLKKTTIIIIIIITGGAVLSP